jgi:hypothetical protein
MPDDRSIDSNGEANDDAECKNHGNARIWLLATVRRFQHPQRKMSVHVLPGLVLQWSEKRAFRDEGVVPSVPLPARDDEAPHQ